MIPYSELLELKRWNTPTIYNGWEQITKKDVAKESFNLEPTTDFMPQMGPMIGYAVTVKIEPSNGEHSKLNPSLWNEYRKYVASFTGPKIVVVQDLDKPISYGAFWGEVNSNIHRALGCIGTITDGAVRDVDEMCNAGFKALAQRLCVGHAHSVPVDWNCRVEAFGTKVLPGQLIHADKHGFLVIPKEDQAQLLDAVRFMDSLECRSLLEVGRSTSGQSSEKILNRIEEATSKFNHEVRKKIGTGGEW